MYISIYIHMFVDAILYCEHLLFRVGGPFIGGSDSRGLSSLGPECQARPLVLGFWVQDLLRLWV